MGKTTRWFKSLLGGGGRTERESRGAAARHNSDGSGGDVANKKRWGLGKPPRSSYSNSDQPVIGDGKQWQKPYMSDSDKEQSRHAIAVAAATAAAADAAMAAAQAAAAVVRLTNQGRDPATAFAGGRERSAAVKIQAAFRGYLARKALRALRALVKLQALVRGYLVRKQAAEDLHRMQSLVRAQSAVLSLRCRAVSTRDRTRVYPDNRHRRSSRADETPSSDHTHRSFHSRRLSASLDNGVNSSDDSPKIVEVDPGRPKQRNRRLTNPPLPLTISCDSEKYCCCAGSKSSPLLCHVPLRMSITPTLKNCPVDWSQFEDVDHHRSGAATAHNTPRFLNTTWAAAVPLTPSKSMCATDGFGRYQAHHNLLSSNHASYMANTQSFTAKLRSLSAPKQRPELSLLGSKKAGLYEVMESRSSLSGIRMQRTCSHAQDIIGFRTSKGPEEDLLSRELEADQYLQRRW